MKISSIIEKPTYQSQVNAGMYEALKMLNFIGKDTYYDMLIYLLMLLKKDWEP